MHVSFMLFRFVKTSESRWCGVNELYGRTIGMLIFQCIGRRLIFQCYCSELLFGALLVFSVRPQSTVLCLFVLLLID